MPSSSSNPPKKASNGSRTPGNQQQGVKRKADLSTVKNVRPKLFIGCTVEALEIARAVHKELEYDLEVTIWNHGFMTAALTTWSQLQKKAQDFDFALFIFSGDEKVKSRGKKSLGVRDNVLIEYGLFVGKLGPERVFFMYNRDAAPKIASDLAGVTPITYQEHTDGNHQAAVSPGSDEIRKAAKSLGQRSIIQNPP